jgi:hypothetical protein
MKKLLLIGMLAVISVTHTYGQKKKYYKPDKSKMTQEQRMIESNTKKKDQGRSADMATKVQRAKKQDRSARHLKPKKKKKR